jgi:hypothetical protein
MNKISLSVGRVLYGTGNTLLVNVYHTEKSVAVPL